MKLCPWSRARQPQASGSALKSFADCFTLTLQWGVGEGQKRCFLKCLVLNSKVEALTNFKVQIFNSNSINPVSQSTCKIRVSFTAPSPHILAVQRTLCAV